MSPVTEEAWAVALALLPLPDLDRLSTRQLDGHVCVLDGDALTTATAVSLGERELNGRKVFLRACRASVGKAAMGALFDHAAGPNACGECTKSADCPTGRVLNRLIRQTV